MFGLLPSKPNRSIAITCSGRIAETKFHETVPDHEKTFPHTETDPINELLLFYDSADPVSAGEIRKIVDLYIDLPARKIMIEAMVLEISSQSLDELGVSGISMPERKAYPAEISLIKNWMVQMTVWS